MFMKKYKSREKTQNVKHLKNESNLININTLYSHNCTTNSRSCPKN